MDEVRLGMERRVTTTPNGRQWVIHERTTRKALVGLQFREEGLERRVRDGLRITAHALAPSGGLLSSVKAVQATPNPDGVYVFHRLPGVDPASLTSPPSSSDHAIVVEVRDQQGRFMPVAFKTADPFSRTDLFLVGGSLSDLEPDFYLFSSPARSLSPRAVASVRAQLWDVSMDRPAAHAILEVEHEGVTWYGLGDHQGSVLAVFPYPPATPSLAGSPPPAPMEGLFDQQWEVTVRVRYQSGASLAALPGAGLLDLGEIVGQPYAQIVPSEEGLPGDSQTASLVFGRELVLGTGGLSVLWIE